MAILKKEFGVMPSRGKKVIWSTTINQQKRGSVPLLIES